MKWFLDLTTRGKLFAGFGLMIVFLAAAIASACLGISAIQASQKHLYQKDFANAVDLLDLRANENGVRAALLSMMAVTRQSDQEIWHQDVKERAKELGEITQRLLERNRNDPRLSGRIEEYKGIREARAQTRDAEVIPLIYAGKTEEARALTLGIPDEHYRKLRAIAQELGETAVENIKQASVQNVSGTRQAEVAAQQLHELGQRLKQLAAQYKV